MKWHLMGIEINRTTLVKLKCTSSKIEKPSLIIERKDRRTFLTKNKNKFKNELKILSKSLENKVG